MNRILHKWWAGEYDSACTVSRDLELIREEPMEEGVEEKVSNQRTSNALYIFV